MNFASCTAFPRLRALTTAAILFGASPVSHATTNIPLDAQAKTIALPVAAQASRDFVADSVSVRLVSRPYFGASSRDAATLEVGPAGLVFLRDGQGGGIVLLGDQTVPLPHTIALDVEGRSARLLDLRFAFDRTHAQASLTLDGVTHAVPASSQRSSIDVAISAGEKASWPIDLLEISTGPAVATDNKSTPLESPKSVAEAALAARKVRVEKLKSTFASARTLAKQKDLASAESELAKANRSSVGTAAWTLESSVRLVELALTLRREYDYDGALALADRALQQLGEISKTAKTVAVGDLVTANELAAFIHEEIRRDPAAARKALQAALELNGKSRKAREGLDRLEADDAKRVRLGGRG